MEHSERLPTPLNPLAERTCFSQVRTPPPSERGRPRQNRSPGTPERDTCRQEAPPRDPLAQLDSRVDLNMDLKVVCPAFGVVPGYNDAVVAACGAAAGPPSGSACA